MFTAPAAPVESPAQRAAFYTSKAHSFAQRAAASLTEAGRAYESEQAAKYLRFAAFASSLSAPVEAIAQPEPVAAPVEVAKVERTSAAPQAKPQPVRSERVQAMRRFYAVASEHKLSTRNAQAMTEALSKYLRVVIPSRSMLSAGHWAEASAAVELGILFW